MNAKYLADYTKEELHNLDEQTKNHIFAIECASRGIALPSAMLEIPEDPSMDPEMTPDLTLYQVKIGYSSNELFYENGADAQNAADNLNKGRCRVSSSYSSAKSRLHIDSRYEPDSAVVETIKAYSEEKWGRLESRIKEYDANKAKRDEAVSYNRKLRDEHDKIWTEIESAVSEADYESQTADRLKKQLEVYTNLANNDMSVAKRFLINAHHEDLERLSPEALQSIGLSTQDLEGPSAVESEGE